MNYIYNFPISMLRDFMKYTDNTLDNILDFCIWQTYKQCKDIDTTKETLGISIGSNVDDVLRNGKGLYNRHADNGYPWTGISHDLFWSYMRKGRSGFDKACLLAFLAIKSLIGQKPYYKLTNQSILFKRMAGYKESDNIKLPKEIAYFTTRYRFDKIKLELKENWNIVIYASYMRGMYLSTSLTLDELALQAEKNKLRTRRMMQTRATAEARKKALAALK